MEVLRSIRNRRSIRSFKTDVVSDDQIAVLIESARLAPSGTNSQPWRFIVIKDAATRLALQHAAHNQRHVGSPPVVIACCADIDAFYEFPERIDELIDDGALPEKSRPFFVPALKKSMDATSRDDLLVAAAGNTAIAITNMMIQASEMGLGTCWVRWFDDAAVKGILDIPDNVEVMALLPVGVPDETPRARPRVSADAITFYEKYGRSGVVG